MTSKFSELVATVTYATIVAGMPSLSFAADGVLDELRRCASVDDASSRLACYDKLGGRRVSSPETIVAPATPVAVGESVASPPDDFGAESLRRADGNKDDDVAVIATVNRCVKDARKKYVFYLDGGQVWKQVNDKRLSFRDCNFNVTIRKDFFGYKMQLEGEKVKFRVSRVR